MIRIAQAPDERTQCRRFTVIHARCRFIEEEQLGMGGHGTGNFQLALLAIGQTGRNRTGIFLKTYELQEIHGPLPCFLFFLSLAFRMEHAGQDTGMKLGMAADQAVFKDRHLGKEADILERPGNAQGRDFMRLLSFNGRALKEDIPFRYPIYAGNKIEQSRLAGAIRTDNAINLAFFHGKGNIRRSRDAAEPFDDML